MKKSARLKAISKLLPASGLLCLMALQPARADITIGVILSLTGPAASLGIPAENTVKLWPTKLAGQNVHVIVVNDKSDTSETAKLTSKLIDEDHVDVIVGPSLTPNSVAAVEIAGRDHVPIIALGGWQRDCRSGARIQSLGLQDERARSSRCGTDGRTHECDRHQEGCRDGGQHQLRRRLPESLSKCCCAKQYPDHGYRALRGAGSECHAANTQADGWQPRCGLHHELRHARPCSPNSN